MEFVKYIDENTIEIAPIVIFLSDKYIANPTDETLVERGYRPLVVDEEPEIGENEYLEPRYTIKGNYIAKHWVVMEFEPIEEEE